MEAEQPEDINKFLYGEEAGFEEILKQEEEKTRLYDEEKTKSPGSTEHAAERHLNGDSKRGLTSVSLSGPAQQAGTSQKDSQQQGLQQRDVDLSAVPLYPGTSTSLFDVDLDEAFPGGGVGLEKPWRRPGADITDYFNFGFNEFTWRQYCTKQKMLREEFGVGRKMYPEKTANSFNAAEGSTPPSAQSNQHPQQSGQHQNHPSGQPPFPDFQQPPHPYYPQQQDQYHHYQHQVQQPPPPPPHYYQQQQQSQYKGNRNEGRSRSRERPGRDGRDHREPRDSRDDYRRTRDRDRRSHRY